MINQWLRLCTSKNAKPGGGNSREKEKKNFGGVFIRGDNQRKLG